MTRRFVGAAHRQRRPGFGRCDLDAPASCLLASRRRRRSLVVSETGARRPDCARWAKRDHWTGGRGVAEPTITAMPTSATRHGCPTGAQSGTSRSGRPPPRRTVTLRGGNADGRVVRAQRGAQRLAACQTQFVAADEAVVRRAVTSNATRDPRCGRRGEPLSRWKERRERERNRCVRSHASPAREAVRHRPASEWRPSTAFARGPRDPERPREVRVREVEVADLAATMDSVQEDSEESGTVSAS